MDDNIYYSPRLQETSIIHNHLNNIEFSMKRVVIEPQDTIHINDCEPKMWYAGERDSDKKKFVIIRHDGMFFVLHHDGVTGKKYDTPKDVMFDYKEITFYQFPDFRSAMEYYLEQSK